MKRGIQLFSWLMADDYEWRNEDPNAPAHFPEWSCAGTFSFGRRFANMTYAELYCEIQQLHVKNGGTHLDVQNRAFSGKEMEVLGQSSSTAHIAEITVSKRASKRN